MEGTGERKGEGTREGAKNGHPLVVNIYTGQIFLFLFFLINLKFKGL